MSSMDFQNSTALSDLRLVVLFEEALWGWNVGDIQVRVRYSRSAEFSGTCFYADKRIFVNLGRHLKFPFRMESNLGRARSMGRIWRRPTVLVELKDAYQLALFIFLHELYHLLVKRAGRNTRQKESMCDRFAAKYLVDHSRVSILDPKGQRVSRTEWDFQDLDGFVARARDPRATSAARRSAKRPRPMQGGQGYLFEV
ncbi:MAG: hypothetical protein HY287_11445 [Planctomycetes bacterium]|nr:hypothetical protein [Planctomycetota bacterium]MBI3834934.1 hypothetical protein [Planctomycetota bacterium]